MKKITLTATLTCLLLVKSSAFVTIQFSSPLIRASNFQNLAGLTTSMVWGIMVDTDQDGFDDDNFSNSMMPGFLYSANAASPFHPNFLSTGISDDVIVFANQTMALFPLTDGTISGQNSITTLVNISYTSGISEGDPYKIIWFDYTALDGSTSLLGQWYGTYQMPTLNTMPADISNYNFTSDWVGPDPAKPVTKMLFAPEPSTGICMLGSCLIALRRKRN